MFRPFKHEILLGKISSQGPGGMNSSFCYPPMRAQLIQQFSCAAVLRRHPNTRKWTSTWQLFVCVSVPSATSFLILPLRFADYFYTANMSINNGFGNLAKTQSCIFTIWLSLSVSELKQRNGLIRLRLGRTRKKMVWRSHLRIWSRDQWLRTG